MSAEGDLFDIEARLKEIDGGYFLVRNRRLGRYEVHHAGQRGSSLAVVVPYARLDERTVRLVRRTRAERAEELMRETERENERLARAERADAVRRAAAASEAILGRGE